MTPDPDARLRGAGLGHVRVEGVPLDQGQPLPRHGHCHKFAVPKV